MQTAVVSLLFLALSLLLAIGGMLLVRRSTRLSSLEAHREIAGFVYATVGVIYAVLLAFVCIVAWERFDEASSAVEQEGATVTSLYQLAQGFSPPARQPIQSALLNYTREVTGAEWELMQDGKESPRAAQLLGDLWQDYSHMPDASRAQPEYGESLRLMGQLQTQRSLRLDFAEGVVPRVVWVFLLAGAVLTIAFTYLFGVKSLTAQSLITGAITLMVAGVLILTYVLDDPFRGDVRVSSQSLHAAQELITTQLGQASQTSSGQDPNAVTR